MFHPYLINILNLSFMSLIKNLLQIFFIPLLFTIDFLIISQRKLDSSCAIIEKKSNEQKLRDFVGIHGYVN